jgi:hypothetical protein
MQTILAASVVGSLSLSIATGPEDLSAGSASEGLLRRPRPASNRPFWHLIVFVGHYVTALVRAFFAADLKPSLPLACVLPGARVFCRCTKTLTLTAIDSRTADLNCSAAMIGVCNDSTSYEQERYGGCNRARSRGHLSDVPPIELASFRRGALVDGSLVNRIEQSLQIAGVTASGCGFSRPDRKSPYLDCRSR